MILNLAFYYCQKVSIIIKALDYKAKNLICMHDYALLSDESLFT